MAYRGKPVLVWDMTASGQPPRKCIRMEDRLKSDEYVWNAPEVIRWHSNASHIIILYQDTKLVDWDLVEDEQVEYDHVGARQQSSTDKRPPDSPADSYKKHFFLPKDWLNVDTLSLSR